MGVTWTLKRAKSAVGGRKQVAGEILLVQLERSRSNMKGQFIYVLEVIIFGESCNE